MWQMIVCLTVLGLWVPCLAAPPSEAHNAQTGPTLFPAAKPIDAGYLAVDPPHRIHYQLHGNPKGKPVFVLHGGPGFGCYPRLVQYFDPEKFLIVLHDQRGAGRSLPAGEIRQNTTRHLVADIEALRKHLKIEDKIMVYGGSWGSTLALAYAQAHPQRVSCMVLRGVFTATKDEVRNPFGGEAARLHFPDAVADMEAALPTDCEGFTPAALFKILTGEDRTTAKKVMAAWIRYAIKTNKLHVTEEEVQRGFGDFDPFPGAKIDCHYAMNQFFLGEDQLLRDAAKLEDIPITLINGRYDVICPPANAHRLHKRLPKSKLIIVEQAGHSESEPGTTRAILEAVAANE